jgi:flagellin-like protein
MSKANQAFKQNDEAVSPVIGVILMVAITVVLAAVVFVLVSNLGKGTDAKPQVGFTKDENGANPGGTLTVATITNGPITLSNIVLGGKVTSAAGGASVGDDMKDTCDWSNSNATILSAGDQLVCADIGTITISESTTGTLLYSGSFA